MPATVVCFKWGKDYTAAHVNALYRMTVVHYLGLERFICVTDDPVGLDIGVDVVPLWGDLARLPNPRGLHFPSCYPRLKMFAAEAGDLFGPRFIVFDLDAVIVAPITELLNRAEDFVAWRDPIYPQSYNGSMVMQTAGARRRVWDSFDANVSPQLAHRAGCKGSDQGWISYALGPDEATWSKADGVYSFSIDLKRGAVPLPADAKIVFFHGARKPWGVEAQRLQWVREKWG